MKTPKLMRPVLLAFVAWTAALPPTPAAQVVVTRVDGVTAAGTLEQMSDKSLSLVLTSATADVGSTGAAVEIPWTDLTELAFLDASPAPSATPDAPAAFHFNAGGTLHGEVVAAGPDAVVMYNPRVGELVVPFAQLEAVTFHRTTGPTEQAGQLLASARAERQAGQDVLVATDGNEAKAVPGALTRLDPQSSEFLFNNRPRRIETARIFGVVFAAGAQPAAAAQMLLKLRSGDAVPGQPASDALVGRTLRFATSFGRTLDLPLDALASLEIRNPRVVPLSDLEPQSVKTSGLIHEPWPWRRDRSVGNTPMSLAGRRFDRGLGVHARTELVYALDGAYETFAATVGIDDEVRPRGAVEFLVAVDGQSAWTSGVLRGTDRPRPVVVPVAGARTLKLTVDFGPGADLADWADWADARLIRPAPSAQTPP